MKILFIHFVVLVILSGIGVTSSTAKTAPGPEYLLQDTVKKPIISIEEGNVKPFSVLAIKDSATSIEDISRVLGRGYGELFAFTGRNNLIPMRVMAFYYSYQPPITMDIGIEVGLIPANLPGRIYEKKIQGGKACIAHFQGPYNQVEIAYNAIANKLKEENKEASGQPFEVYLNSPATVKDPYELRTDIYQLYK